MSFFANQYDSSLFPPSKSERLLFWAPVLCIVALTAILISASCLWAAEVRLAWDSTSVAPDGYRLYQRVEGSSYDYSSPVWSGPDTNCSISDLTAGTLYHFVIRAYDGTQESGDSNEVSFQPDPLGDTPQIADGNDQDNDGMPDSWERQYGLDPGHDDSGLDPDDDGISNIEEYQSGSDPANAPQNQAPLTPEILSPADGDTGVDMLPRIEGSDFADFDAGDSHGKTEWLIVNADTRNTVFHAFREQRWLTRLRVPYLVLDASTTYICQVRYYDNHGMMSEWSSPINFTTRLSEETWWNRNTYNGLASASPADLNANGTPDVDEPQIIRTLRSLDGHTDIGISVDEVNSEIDAAANIDASIEYDDSETYDLSAYELFTYRILVDEPGMESVVTMHFNGDINPRAAWLCHDAIGEWNNETGETYPQTDDTTVIRIVADGGPEDVDGTANGVIIDALGIAADGVEATPGAPIPGGGSASGAGCFIGSLLE